MTTTQKIIKLVSPDADFIHEQAEYLEAFESDQAARRASEAEYEVLESWFWSNREDFNFADGCNDTAEISRLAADLRGKLDALDEAEEEHDQQDEDRREYYADLSAGMRGW